jgi:hypothetical protein
MSIAITKQFCFCYTSFVSRFSDYLEQKYLEWQHTSGKRKTIDQFAEYLECKRPLVSRWMGGTLKPGRDKIERLAELLGPEIYDALELPRPDPKLHYVKKHWEETPKKVQKKIMEEIQRYTTEKAPDDE